MQRSWVPVPDGSDFPVQNLPFGRFRLRQPPGVERGERSRLGVAIGDQVLAVGSLARRVGHRAQQVLDEQTLNAYFAAGPTVWGEVRGWLTECLTAEAQRGEVEPCLVPLSDVELLLPFEVGDFVDFYSSEHHARNMGRILRPDAPGLLPNWKHLPVGYHGRAGTVVVSGTPVVRPRGQSKSPRDSVPKFGPSARLDIEAEVGFVVGCASRAGESIAVEEFDRYVFGMCLLNDWSARDLQAWEYVPLGPFLGKSFLTTVSPWVVPLAALEEARVAPPRRDVVPLPYLRDAEGKPWALDVQLEVRVNRSLVSRPPLASTYWTGPQQLAHMTVNGASVRPGDIYASGTISGPGPDQVGSLMELSLGGTRPIEMDDGSRRTFLDDGDEVTLTGRARGLEGVPIGFGQAAGRIVASPR